jgi:hypothetical protein
MQLYRGLISNSAHLQSSSFLIQQAGGRDSGRLFSMVRPDKNHPSKETLTEGSLEFKAANQCSDFLNRF